MKGDLLKRLMVESNGQLEQQNLKISNANVAVVDASIIESIGAPKRKPMDVEENGAVTPTPASKDEEAKWVENAGRFYLGSLRLILDCLWLSIDFAIEALIFKNLFLSIVF